MELYVFMHYLKVIVYGIITGCGIVVAYNLIKVWKSIKGE